MLLTEASAVPIPDKRDLGRRLRGLRIERGYDRAEDLSEAVEDKGVELGVQALYRIERGKQDASLPQFMALLEVLDVSWDRFFDPL